MKDIISEHSCGQVMTDGSSSGLGAESREEQKDLVKRKTVEVEEKLVVNYTAKQ